MTALGYRGARAKARLLAYGPPVNPGDRGLAYARAYGILESAILIEGQSIDDVRDVLRGLSEALDETGTLPGIGES